MRTPVCPDPRHEGSCPVVLELTRRVDGLEAENKLLRDRLRHQERTAKEAPFGSS